MNKFNQTKPLQWFGKPCLVLSWVWKSLQCVSISHFETLLSLQMYLYRFYHKVNRCLARYSPRATTTSQSINRAPNEPAMVRNAKFGGFWAKNPFFTGEIKSFVTHITKNPSRHLVQSFWSALDKMCKKMPIFGPK